MEAFGGPVPLSDTEHFADTGINPEPLLDPTLMLGQRKLLTTLDKRALEDIGWQLVPEPGSISLLLGSFLVIASRRHVYRPKVSGGTRGLNKS